MFYYVSFSYDHNVQRCCRKNSKLQSVKNSGKTFQRLKTAIASLVNFKQCEGLKLSYQACLNFKAPKLESSMKSGFLTKLGLILWWLILRNTTGKRTVWVSSIVSFDGKPVSFDKICQFYGDFNIITARFLKSFSPHIHSYSEIFLIFTFFEICSS